MDHKGEMSENHKINIHYEILLPFLQIQLYFMLAYGQARQVYPLSVTAPGSMMIGPRKRRQAAFQQHD